MRSTEAVLPLGDSALIFQLDREIQYSSFYDKSASLQAVYLPLSPDLLLVGTADDKTPDLSKIPLAIAQCSLEYFISSAQSSANDILHAHIGKSAYLFSEDQIADFIKNAINKWSSTQVQPNIETAFSYSRQVADITAHMQEELNTLIQEQHIGT